MWWYTARTAVQTIVCLRFIHLERTHEPYAPYPPFSAILLVIMVEATLLFVKSKDRGPHHWSLEFHQFFVNALDRKAHHIEIASS